MNAESTNRDHVMRVMREMEARYTALAREPEAAGFESPVEPARLAAELRGALRWMETEEPRLARRGAADDLKPGAEYVSHNQVVSLVQAEIARASTSPRLAAAESSAEAFPGSIFASLLRGKADFIRHQSLQDFRFTLPDTCTVALVADWGTGTQGAVQVMQQIARAEPQHLIHLGDIYHAGTEEEVRDNFISILEDHGPAECRFWALNGNHEMHSGGHAYFGTVLRFCGQPASYFALGNTHWRFVAIDTAYHDYRVKQPQLDWIAHVLAEEGPRNILLSHHQVFCAIDGRPDGHDMDIHLGPLAEPGNVFGWLWGHGHRCIVFDQDPARGGMRARCIGHGGKDEKHFVFKKPRHPAPPVLKHWEIPRGDDPKRMMNGFALMRFDGPRIDISYVAADGRVWFTETWRADG